MPKPFEMRGTYGRPSARRVQSVFLLDLSKAVSPIALAWPTMAFACSWVVREQETYAGHRRRVIADGIGQVGERIDQGGRHGVLGVDA